jgi:hypothetical protein
MGGTALYEPLNYAVNEFMAGSEHEGKFHKKIFMLTDGAVKNPQKLIEFASQNASKTTIHTFGIGGECSKALVKGVALAGKGSFQFVKETDNLKGRVVKALARSLDLALSGCLF